MSRGSPACAPAGRASPRRVGSRSIPPSTARHATGPGAPDVQITVTVNDAVFTREVEPRLLLIHFLRDELRAHRLALGLRHLQLQRLRGLAGRAAR